MGDQETATSPIRMRRGLYADEPMVVTDPAVRAATSIAAYGEFDLHTAHLIASAITAAVKHGARQLVLDLRHATFLDCSTLHALLSAAAPLRTEAAASVVVTGAQGIVKRFFDLVGVDPQMPVAGRRDDANAALRARSPGQEAKEMGHVTSSKRRILVGLDPAVGEATAGPAMLDRKAAEIYIVAPVLPSRLAWLTNDDGDATAAAEQQLDHALDAADDAGLTAAGSVGSDDDLLTVIGDALAQFPAEEIVLVTLPDQKSHWRVEDLAAKVRERHGKPLRELVLTAREAGAADGV
jgi:anti-anti-sigma factor